MATYAAPIITPTHGAISETHAATTMVTTTIAQTETEQMDEATNINRGAVHRSGRGRAQMARRRGTSTTARAVFSM